MSRTTKEPPNKRTPARAPLARKRRATKARKKPNSRRKRLEKATEKKATAFYRGLPCVICRQQGKINTNTCGHHLVPKGRCRRGRHEPANIIPLCPAHHTMGNDIAAHSQSSLVVNRFCDWMQTYMPKRWTWLRVLEAEAKLNRKPMTITEIETDHDFWESVVKNKRDYETVCEICGVEAWPK